MVYKNYLLKTIFRFQTRCLQLAVPVFLDYCRLWLQRARETRETGAHKCHLSLWQAARLTKRKLQDSHFPFPPSYYISQISRAARIFHTFLFLKASVFLSPLAHQECLDCYGISVALFALLSPFLEMPAFRGHTHDRHIFLLCDTDFPAARQHILPVQKWQLGQNTGWPCRLLSLQHLLCYLVDKHCGVLSQGCTKAILCNWISLYGQDYPVANDYWSVTIPHRSMQLSLIIIYSKWGTCQDLWGIFHFHYLTTSSSKNPPKASPLFLSPLFLHTQ